MDNYTLKTGAYYGYPHCCIEWFSNQRIEKHPNEFIPLTEAQSKAHGGTGFIPCPTCAEKVTAETLHTLIKDRQAKGRFPNENEVDEVFTETLRIMFIDR